MKISATAYLGEFHSNRNRAKYYTLLVCIISSGVVVQPLLALAIIPLDLQWDIGFLVIRPWRLYILAGNIIPGLVLCGMLYLPEGPKYSLARGRETDALHTLATVFSVNTGRPKEVRHTNGFKFSFFII